MRLPTYASGSGAFNVRDAAAQDDTSGISAVRRGDAAREGDGISFAELLGEAAV
jgi:hypothetical protein